MWHKTRICQIEHVVQADWHSQSSTSALGFADQLSCDAISNENGMNVDTSVKTMMLGTSSGAI